MPRPREDLLVVRVDDDLVIYERATGSLHLLEGTAAAIWDHIDGHRPVADIVAAFADEAEPDAPTVRRDIETFLEALRARGLLAE